MASSNIQSSIQIPPFCFKWLHNQSPLYIKDLLSLKPAANHALCSSTQSLLFVPKDEVIFICIFIELTVINYKNKWKAS